MLRSKYHRPWQPRVSDSPTFNPFAHGTESGVDLSVQIEESELESSSSAAHQTPASPSDYTSLEGIAPMIPDAQAPSRRSRWYSSWIGRLTRH